MSFRARLTSFFLLIVVVPMAAMGFLVFRLIDDSQAGKAEARANGIASAAASVYEQSSRSASLDARMLARVLQRTAPGALRSRVSTLAAEVGVARVTVSAGGQTIADVGARNAVAPGVAVFRTARGARRSVTLSELTADAYGAELTGRGYGIVVRQGQRTLSSTFAVPSKRVLPRAGQIRLEGRDYQAVTTDFSGFGRTPVSVTVLSDVAATGGSVGSARLVAAAFILGFLILAFGFSLLASRALQGQLSAFLSAARRLARGDFSSPVRTRGKDEFALLGAEFNNMSQQLARRLEELRQEQRRVRRSIRHIGEAFAANLDRAGLLQIALRTAMDATGADRGRVSSRETASEPLEELFRVGRLNGLEEALREAERAALADGIGEAWTKELSLATVALGDIEPNGPAHGLITVCRPGKSFNEDDLELLRSLAGRATLALANVDLHFDVQRQAITDDLTGLSTHGHFQQLLSAEMEQVQRYQYSVALIMIDIDDFKSINDDHGHPQGDVVLRYVAEVLRQTSRDADVAARYGGEEMALVLPHTDLDGAYVIADRVREAIQALRIPRLDGGEVLRITASLGVAASAGGTKDELIVAADTALYVAKRDGKNRTVKAHAETANVFGGR